MADTPVVNNPDLVNMSSQFSGLPMDQLIGGPLQAACDAQTLLAKASTDFIAKVGLQADATGNMTARTVDFAFTRPVQDPQTGTVTEENVSMKVPLLAIINTPSLAVKEVDVEFTMEVKSSSSLNNTSSKEGSLSAAAQLGWGPFSASVKIEGSISSKSENTRASDNSAKYDVKVIARDDGQPEGLKRVLDMLNSAIQPRSTTVAVKP